MLSDPEGLETTSYNVSWEGLNDIIQRVNCVSFKGKDELESLQCLELT